MMQVVEGLVSGAVVLAVAGSYMRPGVLRVRSWRDERSSARLARDAHAAALEASLETAAFAPARIQEAVDRLLEAVDLIWAGRPVPAIDALDVRVIQIWARRRNPAAHTVFKRDARVDLLRVENRGVAGRDLVTVRIRLTLIDVDVPRFQRSRRRRVDERWTLMLDNPAWQLVSTASFLPTKALLDSAQIATRADDDEHLREQAVIELTDSQADSRAVAQLTDSDSPAYRQLLDLSVVDDRFSPDLIEITLNRLVGLWEQSVLLSSGRRRMSHCADPSVITELMFPKTAWEHTALSITDPSLVSWEPVAINPQGDTAQLEVKLTVLAIRYLTYRPGSAGGLPPGNRLKPRRINLHWTLLSTQQQDPAWRLSATSNPAAAIPAAIS